MKRVVISTVGTSLLTNRINRANPDEKDWYKQLRDSANLNKQNTHQVTQDIIETLRERASQELKQSNVDKIRLISAELNCLYAVYKNQLAAGEQDKHYLIATDTYQCQTTAEVVHDFLRQQGLSVEIYTPPGLSTTSTETFASGIDDLISWLETTCQGYDKTHQICFNLVGSFKSLQGYLNTIGMFYADEILYIFEGKGAELITIPRLPIVLDYERIKPFTADLALMAAGLDTPVNVDNQDIPESLVLKVDEEMTLSTWGKLVWTRCKKDLLSQELIKFPRLSYDSSFIPDYNQIGRPEDRVELQETLAKVSMLLEQNNGDTIPLKQDSQLRYNNYINKSFQVQGQPIGHFRVTQELRVSCISKSGVLELRKYGLEPVINKNP